MKGTIRDFIGAVCVMVLPILLLYIVHGFGH